MGRYLLVLVLCTVVFQQSRGNDDIKFQDLSFNEISEQDIDDDIVMEESKCVEMGFNPQTLLCSSCDLLDEYSLSEIRISCSKCCKKIPDNWSSSAIQRKYPKAILEVCNCKLGALPHLTDFLQSDLRNKYPTFIQKHVNGVWPTISLINEEGNVERTYSITKWNKDTIVEFLDTYLS